MPRNESEAKAEAMMSMEGAGGATAVPPPVVSPAAWPRERSLRVWIAANCERCDDCDRVKEPLQPCRNAATSTPKKIA